MADLEDRFPENIPGPFFVTDACIDCDMCRETAPETFQRNEDIGFSVVFRQPRTPEEIRSARLALEGCPVDAIGELTPE